MTTKQVIALLDYGSGNLRSVEKALRQVGAEVQLVREPTGLAGAGGLVLPGVGAFDDCVRALDRQGLLEPIREWIRADQPFLGICVGYQALFERSQEFNSKAEGLAVFAGSVVRFPDQPGLKVPQIGWNQLELARPDCPLFRGLSGSSYVYFVHSYYPRPEEDSIVAPWTSYGVRFASAVWRGSVFATQFHPEKSQRVGLQILTNFLAVVEGFQQPFPR